MRFRHQNPQNGKKQASDYYVNLREQMVREQIKSRGIKDKIVLAVMRKVLRHLFVDRYSRADAYDDNAMPIEHGQTISQPYIVALMTWVVGAQRNANVMEVGTGSGYQAALLSTLGATVHTIEIVPELAASADAVITKLGYANVTVRAGDGYAGWPEFAPYDAIIVTVAHNEFKKYTVSDFTRISKGKLVLLDIKGIYNESSWKL